MTRITQIQNIQIGLFTGASSMLSAWENVLCWALVLGVSSPVLHYVIQQPHLKKHGAPVETCAKVKKKNQFHVCTTFFSCAWDNFACAPLTLTCSPETFAWQVCSNQGFQYPVELNLMFLINNYTVYSLPMTVRKWQLFSFVVIFPLSLPFVLWMDTVQCTPFIRLCIFIHIY